VTPEQYAKLIDAYRKDPGNHSAAARDSGMGTARARRGWEFGWPQVGYRAIRPLVMEEQAAARRLSAIHADAEQRRARGQFSDGGVVTLEQERKLAATQRAREALLARSARDNAIGVLGLVQQLLAAAIPQAERVRQALITENLTWREFISLTRSIALVHGLAARSGREALEIEKLRLGLPSSSANPHAAATLAEAVASVDYAQSVVARARALRLTGVPTDTTAEPSTAKPPPPGQDGKA
jgi:hypothetical protein